MDRYNFKKYKLEFIKIEHKYEYNNIHDHTSTSAVIKITTNLDSGGTNEYLFIEFYLVNS